MFDWPSIVPGLPTGGSPNASPPPPEEKEGGSILRKLDKKLGAYLTPANVEKIQESCPFIAIRNGIIGFGFGGLLGLFMSGMGASPLDAAGNPEKITVRSVFREMTTKTWSSAKSLGKIALLFSTIECIIEQVGWTIDNLVSCQA